MLHYQTIDERTLECLKFLQKIPELSTTRLVGGTALALQFGHRISVDIDLFGEVPYTGAQLQTLFNEFAFTIILRDSKNIHSFLIEGIKVDIVHYSYAWLEAARIEDDIRMASIKDIGAMKLAAITGRGSKKDFYDIYLLMQQFTLSNLMKFYNQKYPDGSPFLVLKSLIYFEDAENDSLENIFEMPKWEMIKQFIQKQHKTYLEIL